MILPSGMRRSLAEELAALHYKIQALASFAGTPTFMTKSEREQFLIRSQLRAMKNYAAALRGRTRLYDSMLDAETGRLYGVNTGENHERE